MTLQYRNNVEMIEKLDHDDYQDRDLVTIKIPIAIPYATDSEDFVRVEGLFEHNGEFYRLVKQRLFQDTLHVVCVKDHELAYINQAWEQYVKTFTDNHSDSAPAKTFQTLIKDYLPRTFSLILDSPGWDREMLFTLYVNNFISDFSPTIIHPPERYS
jgi:hypothetical protein